MKKRTKLLVCTLATLSSALLSSCGSAPEGEGSLHDITQDGQIARLSYRVTQLELEAKHPSNDRTFSATSDGWQWVPAEPSMIRMSLEDTPKQGNGSLAKFTVMNPNAMALRDCSAMVSWWSKGESGNVIPETVHNRRADFDGPLPPGQFSYHSFPLADIPPDRLGGVSVSAVDCARTN